MEESNLYFESGRIRISGVDAEKVSIIQVLFGPEHIIIMKEWMVYGVNLNALYRFVRNAGTNDIVTLVGYKDQLDIQLNKTFFTFDNIILPMERYQWNPQYVCEIDVPTDHFQKTLRAIGTNAKKVCIEFNGEALVLSCKTELGTSEGIVEPLTIVLDGYRKDYFYIKYLEKFLKTNSSKTITIRLGPDSKPVYLEYEQRSGDAITTTMIAIAPIKN